MTTVSVSTRNAQATASWPEVSQLATGMTSACSSWPNPTMKKAIHERNAQTPSGIVVTSSELRAPICRPNRPATRKPSSGRKTIRSYMLVSTLQRVDVFNRDRAAIAVVGHQDRQADRRLGRRHREDEQREHLAGQVAEIGGEGDEVDVDRQQDQF